MKYTAIQYVEDLYDAGRRSFDDLRDAEKEKLTALVIKESQFPHEFVIETKVSDELPLDIADMLEMDYGKQIKAMTDFATKMLNAAIEYAKPTIDELFERYDEAMRSEESVSNYARKNQTGVAAVLRYFS